MENFKFHKTLVLFSVIAFLSLLLLPGHASSAALAAEKPRNQQGIDTQPPFPTPTYKGTLPLPPEESSSDFVGQQSELSDQEQRELDDPEQQQSLNQPLVSQGQQPQLGTSLQQPFSSFNQPIASLHQQPSGVNNQQALQANLPFQSGVPTENMTFKNIIFVVTFTLLIISTLFV